MLSRKQLQSHCCERVGELLEDNWRLAAVVGIGGAAAVYEAVSRQGETRAIKVIHPFVAGVTELRRRFLREAYIANAIDHPASVRVLSDGETEDGCPYLVMEFLRGRTALDFAEAHGGTIRPVDAVPIVGAVLDILDCAHAREIVHRDVKPENIIVTDSGSIHLLDFGVARFHEQAVEQTLTGVVLGTPGFMAPEQAVGRQVEVGPWTDIWAAGATLFRLLSGRRVHEGTNGPEALYRAATQPAPPMLAIFPECPERLAQAIDRALAFDRHRRFESCAEFHAALERVELPESERLTTRPHLVTHDSRTQPSTGGPTRSGMGVVRRRGAPRRTHTRPMPCERFDVAPPPDVVHSPTDARSSGSGWVPISRLGPAPAFGSRSTSADGEPAISHNFLNILECSNYSVWRFKGNDTALLVSQRFQQFFPLSCLAWEES